MATILDEINSLTPFIVTIMCILVILYIIHLKNFYAGTPPGPWGFPFFGYLFMIGNQPFKQFAALSKKYGDVFSLTIGSRYVVVLNHYDVIKEAFIKDGDIFAGKPTKGVPAEYGDYKSLFVTEGKLWKEQRRFILSSMKDFGLGRIAMEEHIREEAKLAIDKLMKHENELIDVKEKAYLAATNVISFLLFGQRFTKEDEGVLDSINDIKKIIVNASQVSVLEAFPVLQKMFKALPSFSVLMNAKKNVYTFFEDKIEKHRKSFDFNNIRDLADTYIMKYKEVTTNGQEVEDNIYDVTYMRANMALLYLAGIDTSGGTLTWALKLLALYPHAQQQIQQEIDDVIGRERPPSMKDKINMPYTESTILEIHRFISLLPFTLYHQTKNETYLRGYRIPKHSFVLANLWSVHYDPRIWENPFEFKPDRFLDKDRKISNLRDYLIPFSIGKRNCLGESLAKMEIFLFTVCFLQKMKFHLTEEDNKFECVELPIRTLKSCKLIVTRR